MDAYDIVDNKPKSAAYRAPGAPNVVWAVENLMDEIAEVLNMDPMELRMLNVATEGTRRADGVKNLVIGAKEVMEAVVAHPHYSEPLEGENRGRGISMGFCRNNTGPACAIANVLSDGTVSLVEGSVDIGGSRASIAQQLAEVLGIPVEDVNPSIGDTDEVGLTSPTGGSGVTYKSGIAAYEAAMDVRRQMISRAAILWEVEEEQVEYVDGSVRHKSDPELRLTFKEMASKLGQTGGPVVGRGNVSPTGSGGVICGEYCRRGSRPGDGEGGHFEVHGLSGRRQGDTSELRGRPDTGWEHPGYRLGAQRRVLHGRRRKDGEFHAAGLPDAHSAGHTDDRAGDSGKGKPRAPVWGEGGG